MSKDCEEERYIPNYIVVGRDCIFIEDDYAQAEVYLPGTGCLRKNYSKGYINPFFEDNCLVFEEMESISRVVQFSIGLLADAQSRLT